jgi:CheY-like chemotaxis protein
MMGGTLQVQSTVGEGTRFWFEAPFPISRVNQSGMMKKPSTGITGYGGPVRSILVVEDQPENRRLMVDLLTPLGFTLHLAETGGEGVRSAIQHSPDLILMDLLLPDISGIEAVRQIRETPALATTPVIAVSASHLDKGPDWIHQRGFQAFLPKPVDLDGLLSALKIHLGLTWQIADNGPPSPSPTVGMVTPDTGILEEIARMAKSGYMFKVIETAETLKADDPRYAPFAGRLIELAETFDAAPVIGFLQGKGDPQIP